MWKTEHVLRAEAGAGEGGGGGGAAAAAAGGEGSLLSAAAGASGVAGAAGTDAGKAGAAAGATGAAAGAGAAADAFAWLPEKFRVKTADGAGVDLEASAKKLAADGYAPLEKRLGSIGAPPDNADGYKTEGALDTLKKAANGADINIPPELVKDFNAFAHKAGLTQGQYDQALVAYMGGIQRMVDQSFDNAMATAQRELVKVWGADGLKADSAQMKAAYRAFMAYAPAAMRTPQSMDSIGNNPLVLQILESVGREMKEDTRLHGEGGMGDDIQKMMNSEPYWNRKHAEHASTVRRVNEFFSRGGKINRAA